MAEEKKGIDAAISALKGVVDMGVAELQKTGWTRFWEHSTMSGGFLNPKSANAQEHEAVTTATEKADESLGLDTVIFKETKPSGSYKGVKEEGVEKVDAVKTALMNVREQARLEGREVGVIDSAFVKEAAKVPAAEIAKQKESLDRLFVQELAKANKDILAGLNDGSGKNDKDQILAYADSIHTFSERLNENGNTDLASSFAKYAEKIRADIADGAFVNTGTSRALKDLAARVDGQDAAAADKALAVTAGIVTSIEKGDANNVVRQKGDSRVVHEGLAAILSESDVDIKALTAKLETMESGRIAAVDNDFKAAPATFDPNAMSKTEVAV